MPVNLQPPVAADLFPVAGVRIGVAEANSFIAQALSYTGTAKYTLTKLTNEGLQDLVVATAITSAVPEPGSYALFLAGLSAIGLIARRRLPR